MKLELKKNEFANKRQGPVLLIIMDGIGLGKKDDSNAVYLANTPTLDKLFASELYTKLKAHGPAVGLPSDDDMGNSEVGHNALGAGRIFDQGAKLVNKSIATGNIYNGKAWNRAIENCRNSGTLHFIGLLSDGNVHSNTKHLFALLDRAKEENQKKVRIHILTDGRDVGERTALNYVKPLEEKLQQLSIEGFDYKIASGGGRMITTMDRYNADWSIVERGWNTHVLGEGRKFNSASEAIKTYYSEDDKIVDQYLQPFVVVDENGNPNGTIQAGDSVIFFNFRGDRAIEISKAFEEKEFTYFERKRFPEVFYAGMMEYDGDAHIPKNFLVEPPSIDRTLSEYICAANIKSFAISETQKYGHVTYFWNGNRSGYINEKLEKYIEIPSDKISFDKAPEMKAKEITEETIKLLKSNEYKFGRINYPNGDMVGHTGSIPATIKAVEAVDAGIKQLLDIITEMEGIAIITADHGNADEMFTIKNGTKNVKTAHTLNPVPFIIYDSKFNGEYEINTAGPKGLANVAGTLLNLLGYENVKDYEPSLIKFK